jgi:hypothetical protein
MNEHNTDSADCWCDPEVREVGDSKVIIHQYEVPCKTHPDAPHGFDRNASHALDRYVCTCEHWEPEDEDHSNCI